MRNNEGLKVYEDIIKYAHNNNLTVVVDAKRNDIGNTTKMGNKVGNKVGNKKRTILK